MPEFIRSLLVITFIAWLVFKFAKNTVVDTGLMTAEVYDLRRNVWFSITAAAFLIHNFFIFSAVAAYIIIKAKKKDTNLIALTCLILFLVPLSKFSISGFGVVNYLFELDYFRLLAIVILIPLHLTLRKDKTVEKFGKRLPDKILILYIIYTLILQLTIDTFTNTFRTAFLDYLDIFLPYYTFSRYIKSNNQFKEVLAAFIIAVAIMSLIGLVEMLKSWLLYASMTKAFDGRWGLGSYLRRGADLRAMASTGQPIVFGYVVAVALGMYLYLNELFKNKKAQLAGLVVLLLGLISSLSRGPWIGAIFIYMIFILSSGNFVKNISRFIGYLIPVIFAIYISPYKDKVIDLIPFVGTVDSENIDFRNKLLENSLIVIDRNPWFGSFDYRLAPELLELEAQGIIDIVNTYIGIALAGGYVGVGLFAGFFLIILYQLAASNSVAKKVSLEQSIAGRMLLSTLLGILFIIYTVSSITVIPIVYWLFGGLCVAHLGIIYRDKRPY